MDLPRPRKKTKKTKKEPTTTFLLREFKDFGFNLGQAGSSQESLHSSKAMYEKRNPAGYPESLIRNRMRVNTPQILA